MQLFLLGCGLAPLYIDDAQLLLECGLAPVNDDSCGEGYEPYGMTHHTRESQTVSGGSVVMVVAVAARCGGLRGVIEAITNSGGLEQPPIGYCKR